LAHGEVKRLEDGRSYFSNGALTPKVPFSMFAEHRKKFVAELNEKLQTIEPRVLGHKALPHNTRYAPRRTKLQASARPFELQERYDFVIFEGGILRHFYDTDMELEFKQEANFFWLFGVREPNVKGAIDLRSGESYLFVPRRGRDAQTLSGMNATGENAYKWWIDKYEVDHVAYASDMEKVLIKAIGNINAAGKHGTVSVLLTDEPHDQHGENDREFRPRKLTIRKDPGQVVSKALRDLRLIKDQYEIQIMQYVSDVSAEAHVMAMQQSALAAQRQGIISMEWAAESVFRYVSAMRGCLDVAYEASCPGGSNTAFFHYGADSWEPNSEKVGPDEVRMLDMAAAYFGYTGDVTVSYPENGHFTDKQRLLYTAVLEAQVAAEKEVKPGVTFQYLQEVSERKLLEHLITMGILKGSSEELHRTNIVNTFMPHGVGHSLGLDCHDDQSRFAFAEPFKANWIITVEPAMYFNPSKLDELVADATKKQYVNEDVLAEWRNIGGMRLEDDLLVTETGSKVLTRVPRTIDDIEAVMSGKVTWKPWERTIIEYTPS
jgi:Xaa-Pro dipeptidase